MIKRRPSHERGSAQFSWLNSHHTFSFGSYYDPRYRGVSSLRVLNDDWVKPGAGFETHPHRDMEIISYILEGSIEHRDTMGFHTTLTPGDVQVMSAGTGILHSEFNPSATQPLNFLQMWVQPHQKNLPPRYAQKNFAQTTGLALMVSSDGRDGSLAVNQDVNIFKLNLTHESAEFAASTGRHYYLHIARGTLNVNGTQLSQGDGATITAEQRLDFDVADHSEALLFELP